MVTNQPSIPERGDIMWTNLNPVRGHEQRGRRPALVISPKVYNEHSGLAICCPITSVTKEYPFEVPIETRVVKGVALVDQIRALDWRERRFKFAAKAPAPALATVISLLKKLLID